MDLFIDTEVPDWKQEIPYLAQVSGYDLKWLYKKEYRPVMNIDDLYELRDHLADKKEICVDTETTGVLFTDKVVAVQITACKEVSWFIPIRMEQVGNIDPQEFCKVLGPILEDPERTFIGFNLKFDGKMLRNIITTGKGIDIFKGNIIDLQICFKLKDPDSNLTLKSLVKSKLGIQQLELEHLFKKSKTKKANIQFHKLSLAHAIPYACADTDLCFEVYNKCKDNLNLDDQIVQLEHKVQRIIIDMECRGLFVNKSLLERACVVCDAEIKRLETQILNEAGKDFKINSPVDMGDYLYNKLGLQPLEFTDTGKPAVNKDALNPYKETVPFIDWVLKYKEACKLKSGFIAKIPTYCDAHSSVHPNFNHLGAASGRFSCTDPNFQQLPKQKGSELDFRSSIRQAVQARPGYILFDMDFSQIEYRVFASLCGDENLQKAYHDGLDFHQATAAMCFGVPYDQVTKLQRTAAKTINFGLLYGLSTFSLSQRLGISEAEAQQMYDDYFADKPKVKEWTKARQDFAIKHGYITTYFGRRRLLKEVYSKNRSVYNGGLRKAVNSTVQGTAADILKIAFVRLQKTIKENNLDVYMIATVHDEILFEVGLKQEKPLKEVFKLLQDAMEVNIEGWVPTVADPEAGFNWGSLMDLSQFNFDNPEVHRNMELESTEQVAEEIKEVTIILPEKMPKLAFEQFKKLVSDYAGETPFLLGVGSAPTKQAKSTLKISRELVQSLEDLNITVKLPDTFVDILM